MNERQKAQRVKRLRLAALGVWLVSVTLTMNFVGSMSKPAGLPGWILIWAGCAVVQYGITLAESALFEGELPPPWRFNWADGGPMPWIWCGAAMCLFLDVILNVGGVAYFMRGIKESNATEALKQNYGATEEFLSLLTQLLIIAFSVLSAVGSELLNAYADLIEGGRRQPTKPKEQEKIGSTLQSVMDRVRNHGNEEVIESDVTSRRIKVNGGNK